LRYLIPKTKHSGFTLIELLVTIIIIGILSAIALPAFLKQANKAKQVEAKTYVGTMNRAQQAYYLEKDAFAVQLQDLGLGIPNQTINYRYAITINMSGDGGAGAVATNQAQVVQTPSPLKAYIGGVKITASSLGDGAVTLARMCEGAKAHQLGGPDGTQTMLGSTSGEPPDCPVDYIVLSD
jgi:prepilin-type N-terminal cleavage/methylation domain-containing protein